MRITENRLRQIIREEARRALREGTFDAEELVDRARRLANIADFFEMHKNPIEARQSAHELASRAADEMGIDPEQHSAEVLRAVEVLLKEHESASINRWNIAYQWITNMLGDDPREFGIDLTRFTGDTANDPDWLNNGDNARQWVLQVGRYMGWQSMSEEFIDEMVRRLKLDQKQHLREQLLGLYDYDEEEFNRVFDGEVELNYL